MAVTINNFWGAETGGMEEAYSFSADTAASTTQVRTGGYSYYLPAGSNAVFLPFTAVVDAGQGYIIGAAIHVSSSFSGREVVVENLAGGASGRYGGFSINTNSISVLGNNSVVASKGVSYSVGWHYVELYFVPTDSGAYEMFVDGVSELSGSSVDFDPGTTTGRFLRLTTNIVAGYFDDMYFMSGAASSADRLGGCEVIACRSGRTSVAPNVGTSLDSGLWSYTQEVPFNDSLNAVYSNAGAEAGYITTVSAPPLLNLNGESQTWFLTAADPDSAWLNDANAVDKVTSTYATTYDTGSISANYLKVTSPEYSYPSPPGIFSGNANSGTIKVGADITPGSQMTVEVWTAGKSQKLGETTISSSGTYSFNISLPSGGWTATIIDGLEVYAYRSSGTSSVGLSLVQFSTDARSGPASDFRMIGTIIATKGVWRMMRDGGGGTDHFGLLGNNVDGTTRSADLDPGTAYANYFMVSASTSVMPTTAELCAVGFEKSAGGQNFECADMLAQVLHVPPAAGKGIVYNPVRGFAPFLTR